MKCASLFTTISKEDLSEEKKWIGLHNAVGKYLRHKTRARVGEETDRIRQMLSDARGGGFMIHNIRKYVKSVKIIQRTVRPWIARFKSERESFVQNWKTREALRLSGRKTQLVSDATKVISVDTLWEQKRSNYRRAWKSWRAENGILEDSLHHRIEILQISLSLNNKVPIQGQDYINPTQATVELKVIKARLASLLTTRPQFVSFIPINSLTDFAVSHENRKPTQSVYATGVSVFTSGKGAIRAPLAYKICELFTGVDEAGTVATADLSSFLTKLYSFCKLSPTHAETRTQLATLTVGSVDGRVKVSNTCKIIRDSHWMLALRMRANDFKIDESISYGTSPSRFSRKTRHHSTPLGTVGSQSLVGSTFSLPRASSETFPQNSNPRNSYPEGLTASPPPGRRIRSARSWMSSSESNSTGGLSSSTSTHSSMCKPPLSCQSKSGASPRGRASQFESRFPIPDVIETTSEDGDLM